MSNRRSRGWRRTDRCGAKTRRGTPCQRWGALNDYGRRRNGRCKLHGGLSTGPRTKAGRLRLAKLARERARTRPRESGRFLSKHGPSPPLDLTPDGIRRLAQTDPRRFARLLLKVLR